MKYYHTFLTYILSKRVNYFVVLLVVCSYPIQLDLNLDFEELNDVRYLTNGGMCSIYTAEWRGRRVVVKVRECDVDISRSKIYVMMVWWYDGNVLYNDGEQW